MADLPVLPGGLAVRPLSPDDVTAAAALLEAAEAVDDTGEHWSPDDLTEWWVNDLFDLTLDSVAVTTTGGDLVAWATVLALPTFRDAFRITLEARVHPAWRNRGIGRALLAWQLERGRELHAERHPGSPAVLAVEVYTSMSSLEGLVRRAGLTQERWYFVMERPLTDLPAVPPVEGVELVAFTWDRDDEIRRAHNAAFTEHHGSAERDEATWQTLFTGQRGFRPELSSLAVADGAVVAYALAYVFEADTAANGYETVDLGQIGVLPSARGRGLARATIASVLRAAADRKFGRAALQVDSENVTGALALYEGLGFRKRRTQVQWVLGLAPVSTGTPQ
ncbi:GNAT family N-acetyltransferase [Blastococcus haudaquaticus]|uniref:Mycothiol synthase n=1 Tax=Blastococcus haudaquaticus TaxID=1938745 RepID=A0A286H1A2_9ACTN|nr:GNAT family N-acetyltransferase [Blastococcus haudaquaticus]SOE01547.1 mycothiol synthase [Blastococcus haudaquaticus]